MIEKLNGLVGYIGDISDWSSGCSPSNHTMFYNAIHADNWYEEAELRYNE